MGKKMRFPFPFKFTEPYPDSSTPGASSTAASASSWPWPTCANTPKTLSFRAAAATTTTTKINEESLPCFSDNEDHIVLRGLKSSDRLFFEPGRTSSILEVPKTTSSSSYEFPYKESAAIMGLDSRDPFADFRASMEEMVEAHGLRDWAGLEDLLACYLRLNGKSNHGYIVGAFVDLVLHLALANSSNTEIDNYSCSSIANTRFSFNSPLSFSSSTDSSTNPSMENSDVIVNQSNRGESSCSSSLSLQ